MAGSARILAAKDKRATTRASDLLSALLISRSAMFDSPSEIRALVIRALCEESVHYCFDPQTGATLIQPWKVQSFTNQERDPMNVLPYTLRGRALPDDPSVLEAPCIFCGELTKHINDGGNAWAVAGRLDGKRRMFLYHNRDCTLSRGHSIWRCRCGGCALVVMSRRRRTCSQR